MAGKTSLLIAVALMVIVTAVHAVDQLSGGPSAGPVVKLGIAPTITTLLLNILYFILELLIALLFGLLGGGGGPDDAAVCLQTDYTPGETTKSNEDYGEVGGQTFTELEEFTCLNVITIPDTEFSSSSVDSIFYVLTNQTSSEGDTIIIFSIGRTGGMQPIHLPFTRDADPGATGECQLTGTNMVGPYRVDNADFDSCTMTMQIVEAGDDCRSFIVNICDMNGDCSVLGDIFPNENNCAAFSRNLDHPRSTCCTTLSAQCQRIVPDQSSICPPVGLGGMPLVQITDEAGAAIVVDYPNLVFTYADTFDVPTQTSTQGSFFGDEFSEF